MKRQEIKLILIEAIDLLEASMPGCGSASDRRAKRDAANKKMQQLPPKWWKRLSEKDSDGFLAIMNSIA